MRTRTAFAEVVDHCLKVFKGTWRVGPHVRTVRFAIARFEHLHRSFVSVHYPMAEDFAFERINQGLELRPARAYLGAQRGARQSQASAGKDALLAV